MAQRLGGYMADVPLPTALAVLAHVAPEATLAEGHALLEQMREEGWQIAKMALGMKETDE